MGIQYCVLLFIFCPMLLSNVAQVQGLRHLSEQMTESRDAYDCVNFDKQPAFDHPLLHNNSHNYEMTPSTTTGISELESIGFKAVYCPVGKIPIRRISKQDLLSYNHSLSQAPGVYFAMGRTKDTNRKYFGGQVTLSIYNPKVEDSQYSSGEMKIINGDEQIIVGWTVNPRIYKDHLTRLFIYFDNGKTRCMDLHCPGFVQTNPNIYLGSHFAYMSNKTSTSYLTYLVYKVPNAGDWVLDLEPGGIVGYWPGKLFSRLSQFATSVEYGGEVGGPPNVPSPAMGSGNNMRAGGAFYPNPKRDAYGDQINFVDEHHLLQDPKLDYHLDPSPYDVYETSQGEHRLYFGGLGGISVDA